MIQLCLRTENHVILGSVPGSYLGMDPAFLVWIPPLDEGDIIKEIDDNMPIYEVLFGYSLKYLTNNIFPFVFRLTIWFSFAGNST